MNIQLIPNYLDIYLVPKFDCIDCDLPKTTKHSSPDLVKRLRLFFLPALLLARNKPVMTASKYKRLMSKTLTLHVFLKNVAVGGKTTTLIAKFKVFWRACIQRKIFSFFQSAFIQ